MPCFVYHFIFSLVALSYILMFILCPTPKLHFLIQYFNLSLSEIYFSYVFTTLMLLLPSTANPGPKSVACTASIVLKHLPCDWNRMEHLKTGNSPSASVLDSLIFNIIYLFV